MGESNSELLLIVLMLSTHQPNQICSKYEFTPHGKLPAQSQQWRHSQQTFTCSKSTMETLEKGVKYVQN